VRGSPLLRSILLTIALVIAGIGLVRLTAERTHDTQLPLPPVQVSVETMAGRFHLLLSAPAEAVVVSTGRDEWTAPAAEVAAPGGVLEFDRRNPQVSLIVRWAGVPETGEHRFAKLTLELPGRPTIVHVFDSQGDIDEFVELPLP